LRSILRTLPRGQVRAAAQNRKSTRSVIRDRVEPGSGPAMSAAPKAEINSELICATADAGRWYGRGCDQTIFSLPPMIGYSNATPSGPLSRNRVLVGKEL